MTTKIITYSFYILFFLTPLFWTPANYELFEYNKMILVYLLTILITSTWIIKMIVQKKLLIKSSPLNIPILLFLAANILSTIFSIDPHTSIWGYYSRSNGGLLSIISFTLLFFALISNFNKEGVIKLLKAGIWGGFIVSLWAIPEHFGVSPSCVLLTGQYNASCWVQDVQARVFATLGQPNWLAAYLAMLIFPTLYFLLTSKSKIFLILNSLFLILFYLAFTFTYSRGATLGLLGGLTIFALLSFPRLHPWGVKLNLSLKPLSFILLTFLLANLLFGSSLTNFKLLSKFAPPPRPTVGLTAAPSGTQLESGGTESGTIRLIVWRGALEIFKHYPILGSGVETFAYSYYNFRPIEHNLVSEWDFLYNKAHNEYLNYLATTGIAGFASYMLIIGTFIIWSVKKVYSIQVTGDSKKSPVTSYLLLVTLLASYISYLIQNFFGFSVVIIAAFFFLFPGIAFVYTDSVADLSLSKKKNLWLPPLLVLSKLATGRLTATILKIVVCFIAFIFIFTILKYWVADTFFAEGFRASEAGNPGRAYNNLVSAVILNTGEPFYRSELGFAEAGAAVSLAQEDTSSSANLKNQAVRTTEKVLTQNPKNISFWRTAIRTYYLLSNLDPGLTDKTLSAIDSAIGLAPTDAKLYYNKAVILSQIDKKAEAIGVLNKTLELKPNYKEAYLTLGDLYLATKQKDKAKETIDKLLILIPNDPEALAKLKEWDEKN